jgi:pimeloyl-ACP methyl ester carboxylesterase
MRNLSFRKNERRAARLAALALIAQVLLGPACRRQGPDRAVSAPDGVTIAYHIEGRGSPALVFIHGWSCDRTYWRNQLGDFARSHTVVAVDLAGHGESGAGRKAWSIRAFGADVAAVIKEEGLRRVILIGHSMGGEVSLEAARILPGRVLGIIGVDTFQDFSEALSREQISSAVAYYKADFKTAMNMIARSMFPWGANPDLVEQVVRGMSAADPKIAVAVVEALFNYRPAKTLREVRLPIRVINSDHRRTDVEGNRRLAASFEAKIMVGRGHFPQLEEPGEFNRLLRQTIAELAQPAGFDRQKAFR